MSVTVMNSMQEPKHQERFALRLLPTPAFVWLLAIGFFLRVLVLPAAGFQTDISSWQNWAQKIRHLGIDRMYEPVSLLSDGVTPLLLVDHPPINLYYITFLAQLPFDSQYLHPLFNVLIKLPGLLFDCVVLLLLAAIARKLSYPESAARFIAVVYWLNPGFIYHHSFWGLNESMSATVFLGSLLLLVGGRHKTAIALLVASLSLKFQLIIFLPVAIVFVLLRPRDSSEQAGLPEECVNDRRWFWVCCVETLKRMLKNAPTVASGFLSGSVVLAYLFFPFIVSGALNDALGVFSGSVGRFPNLTQGAYNAWFIFDGITRFSLPDTVRLVAGITPRMIGIVLFGVATIVNILFLIRFCIRRRESLVTGVNGYELLALSFMLQGYSFFMLPTEMHERYIFYAVTFLPLFAWRSKQWYGLYGAVSFTYLANIVLVYNYFHAHWPQATIWHYIIAVFNIACYVYMWLIYYRMSWHHVSQMTQDEDGRRAELAKSSDT